MKIFYKKYQKTVKSWALFFKEGHRDGNVGIIAVDSESGEFICTIMLFLRDGRVVRSHGVLSTFKLKGYDPGEHNNAFDDAGRIVIK